MKLGFVTTQETAFAIVKSMYEGEPCRICGEPIEDANDTVWAGYSSDNLSRCAHKVCWNKNLPKSEWAYPEDDKS